MLLDAFTNGAYAVFSVWVYGWSLCDTSLLIYRIDLANGTQHGANGIKLHLPALDFPYSGSRSYKIIQMGLFYWGNAEKS